MIANSAITIGVTAAMIDAKTTISTISAMAMPIDSPFFRSSSAIFVKSACSVPCPATCTVNPSIPLWSAIERSCSIVVSLAFFRGTVIRVACRLDDTRLAAWSSDCFTTS